MLDDIHWMLYKVYGITYHWPYFHQLVLESIHECIAHVWSFEYNWPRANH